MYSHHSSMLIADCGRYQTLLTVRPSTMGSSSTYDTERSVAATTARAASRTTRPTENLRTMRFLPISFYPGATQTLEERSCQYTEYPQPGAIIEDHDYAYPPLSGTAIHYISLHRSCYDSIFGRALTAQTNAKSHADTNPTLSGPQSAVDER